jgi:ketosteroid isomerase-like protein
LRRDVEEFYAGFTAGDLDRAFRIFAEDVVTVEPALPRAAGLDVWREYDQAFKTACPDASLVLRSAVQEGDRIAVEGSFRGTFTAPLRTPQRELQPTGCSFDVEFADFYVFRDGNVVEHRVYYDQIDFGSQLGILP